MATSEFKSFYIEDPLAWPRSWLGVYALEGKCLPYWPIPVPSGGSMPTKDL